MPPGPVLNSLHGSANRESKLESTCGPSVAAQLDGRADRGANHTMRAVSKASMGSSINCDPRDRDLPLPPIPALPKSYSIGNKMIQSRPDRAQIRPKTPTSSSTSTPPKAARGMEVPKNLNSAASHTNEKPDVPVNRRPRAAIQNCYVTAKYSSAPAMITEPLIDLTPPRQMQLSVTACPALAPSGISSLATNEKEENVTLVLQAQPQQYWLGRLSTLVNSLQYEDAFDEPDPMITHRAPSRTKLLKSCGIESIEEFNIKRAFAALEKACMTSEATKSLHRFKDEYERRYTKSGVPRPAKGGNKAGLADGRQTVVRVGMKAAGGAKGK
ncbi:predicted protein [Uncinocarpus reesii 1704]|uniref:Uncharacterized protein n=1 Tax=Uncinocarpus reesii (strain UAMH 1704) TaxID=336963 RepID=C4JH58_UNCRE|nr:uncharacterized protein UREG_02631 [Uncinocarpus reesii 1704]EEP77782.1 predicted protein [Uncinocarpus reesii 1704]